jgi:uncharacterized protein
MNPVFKGYENYRDSRTERTIIHILLVLVGLAFLALLIMPSREKPEAPKTPEEFYHSVLTFFQDSLSGFHLTDFKAPDAGDGWFLKYSCNKDEDIQLDLYIFGLFCGSRLKRCTVRVDSATGEYVLTIRNRDGKKEGRLRLKREIDIIKGRIVLIIDDFGYAYGSTEKGFFNLDPAVSFSVIPGHSYTEIIAREASRRRHPVMIHMPMEPLKYYGGEEAFMIMDGMDENEIEYRISKAMMEIPMARGMNNHMGSKVTASPDMIHRIAHVLEKKGLFFIDSYTVNTTVVLKTMKAHNIKVYQRDIFIDHDNTEEDIRRQIRKTARIAEKKGIVVAIGHNRPLTLKILTEMIPKLKREGFIFVPPGEL